MNLHKINPYIRASMESVLHKGFYIRPRVIYDFELIYIESGRFTLQYDGQDYEICPGDLLLLHPGVPHSFISLGQEISQPHIHFSLRYTAQSGEIPVSFKSYEQMTRPERAWIEPDPFSEYKNPKITCADMKEFLRLFRPIVSSPPQNEPLRKKGLLLQLLQMIIKENFPNMVFDEPETYPMIDQLKAFIDSGSANQMDLDAFEKQFGYNKFYLEKLFKKRFGCGIIEYRNRQRWLLAQELLQTKSVTETAEILGYRSIYSFSRAYKGYFGKSPKKDRK